MLFTSFEFIYLFLPLALAGYYLLCRVGASRGAFIYLILCSLFFYGWWHYEYLLLLVPSICFNYMAGIRLGKSKNRTLLTATVGANLLLLAYFKYAGFFAGILGYISGSTYSLGDIVLPLAISFFTFQQIAWLVDSFRGQVPQSSRGFTDYCLFVSFFPQLISGPIVHHAEMIPQFGKRGIGAFQPDNFATGLSFFILGLAKKVLLADSLDPIADQVFDLADNKQAIGFVNAWMGTLAYTGQIYFDFSGYADMAIGIGLMFNIILPINFDSPYKSVSIADFWRRWHMTLSRFLRDYLYIALGGNRRGSLIRYRNLLLTMLLGGLWHGANWTFVVWGGIHGIFLLVHVVWQNHFRIRLPRGFSWLFTFLAVSISWVFFRASTLDSAVWLLRSMTNTSGLAAATEAGANFISLPVLAALSIALLTPNSHQLLSRWFSPINGPYRNEPKSNSEHNALFNTVKIDWNTRSLVFLGLLGTASVMVLLHRNTINEFIYFQF